MITFRRLLLLPLVTVQGVQKSLANIIIIMTTNDLASHFFNKRQTDHHNHQNFSNTRVIHFCFRLISSKQFQEGVKTGYDIIKLLYIISSNSILKTDNESYHNCFNC